MKHKIKIIYSKYYYDEIIKSMVMIAEKNLKKNNFEYDLVGVPGSFEIPYEVIRSIKEDSVDNKIKISSFKNKEKKEIRDNIVQMAKLSQLNINNQCIYSGFLVLGCVIKGKTINHQAISTAIFTNLQRISIEKTTPVSNGIFNANNISEAKKKLTKCTEHAVQTLLMLLTKNK